MCYHSIRLNRLSENELMFLLFADYVLIALFEFENKLQKGPTLEF